jgi:hypothetical protein
MGILPLGLFACPPPEQYIVLPGQLSSPQSDMVPGLDPNSTLHNLERRFMYQEGSTWPDNTLTYCFEHSDAEKALKNDLVSAWGLWQAAGLDSRIKFVQGSRSFCQNKDAGDYLVSTSSQFYVVIGEFLQDKFGS